VVIEEHLVQEVIPVKFLVDIKLLVVEAVTILAVCIRREAADAGK